MVAGDFMSPRFAMGLVQLYAIKSWKQVQESLPVWFVGALLIAFLFPRMESLDPNGNPIGLPIRGYGVMLMLGALSGLALTLRRAQPLGLSMDHLLSLATWGFIPGILGARVFYVIQKWGELPGSDFSSKMMTALQLTEGGLVVYGGIIGGLLGTMAWCLRRKLPPLAIADLVVPGFFLGLAFGRIGCLLHAVALEAYVGMKTSHTFAFHPVLNPTWFSSNAVTCWVSPTEQEVLLKIESLSLYVKEVGRLRYH